MLLNIVNYWPINIIFGYLMAYWFILGILFGSRRSAHGGRPGPWVPKRRPLGRAGPPALLETKKHCLETKNPVHGGLAAYDWPNHLPIISHLIAIIGHLMAINGN